MKDTQEKITIRANGKAHPAWMDMAKKQACTAPGCRKPSIPGLRAGAGKCQYHWNAGVWGEKWADEVESRKAQRAK